MGYLLAFMAVFLFVAWQAQSYAEIGFSLIITVIGFVFVAALAVGGTWLYGAIYDLANPLPQQEVSTPLSVPPVEHKIPPYRTPHGKETLI